jgi:hypothetical protein
MELDNLCSALCRMSANFMRVTRGAGEPEALIGQAQDIVFVYEALKAAGAIQGGHDGAPLAVYKSGGGYVGSDTLVVHSIREALDINRKEHNVENRRIESIVAAGLRIAAARQRGDATQEGHGVGDMERAITAFRAAG